MTNTKPSRKHLLQSNAEFAKMLRLESIEQSFLNFCKRCAERNQIIYSTKQKSDSQILVISGTVSFFHEENMLFQLTLIEESGNAIMLGTLSVYRHFKSIFIRDLQISFINKGYGSELLSFFLSFCRYNGIHKVIGKLCPTDINDHHDRLIHFYEKHGFTINGNKIEYTNANLCHAISLKDIVDSAVLSGGEVTIPSHMFKILQEITSSIE